MPWLDLKSRGETTPPPIPRPQWPEPCPGSLGRPISWTDCQRPLKALLSFGEPFQREHARAIVVPVDRLARVYLDSLADQFEGLFVAPVLLTDHAQEVKPARMTGVVG